MQIIHFKMGLLANVIQRIGGHVALLTAGVESQRATVNVLNAKIAGTLVCVVAQATMFILIKMLSHVIKI